MKRTELEINKVVKLNLLKKKTKELQASRHVVDTGLGFSVDGSYQDLQNLEAGKALGLTFVVDSNGIRQNILVTDWDTILTAIRTNGLLILENKWTKQVLINEANTLEELDAIQI